MLALIALLVAPVSLPADGWISFAQPAVSGTHRLGCLQDGRASLDKDRNRWMSFSPNPMERDDGILEAEFDQFDVYVQFENGIAQQVRAYTPDCKVSSESTVSHAALDAAAGVELLDAIIDREPDRDLASHAIAALAHIAHDAADIVLEQTASHIEHDDTSQQALFWLAQRRGAYGRNVVAAHTDAKWPLDHRGHAVMSLALSEQDDALEVVRNIARTADESELRAHAVTALGITNAPGAVADLHSIFLADTDSDVRTQAIFGLAQKDSAQAAETLVAIIRDPRHDEHRRDALFWLANMEGTGAQEAMDELMAEIL